MAAEDQIRTTQKTLCHIPTQDTLSIEIDFASFESLIISPNLSDLFEVEVALLVFHPLRIVSLPSAPRFGNAEMTLFLHAKTRSTKCLLLLLISQ